jgi:hypothetical protein
VAKSRVIYSVGIFACAVESEINMSGLEEAVFHLKNLVQSVSCLSEGLSQAQKGLCNLGLQKVTGQA